MLEFKAIIEIFLNFLWWILENILITWLDVYFTSRLPAKLQKNTRLDDWVTVETSSSKMINLLPVYLSTSWSIVVCTTRGWIICTLTVHSNLFPFKMKIICVSNCILLFFLVLVTGMICIDRRCENWQSYACLANCKLETLIIKNHWRKLARFRYSVRRKTQIKTFNIGNNLIKTVRENTFSGFKYLLYVYLYKNRISYIHPFAFNGLQNLNLNRNKIKTCSNDSFHNVNITFSKLKYLSLVSFVTFLWRFSDVIVIFSSRSWEPLAEVTKFSTFWTRNLS